MEFAGKLLASMEPVPERPDLIRVRMDAQEFKEGVVRITKGLLFTLHPCLDYYNSTFNVIDIHPKPFDEQLKLMARLKQEEHFERGQGAFQCWRHVEEAKGGGVWMMVFYECFGFFVFHTNGPELDNLKP